VTNYVNEEITFEQIIIF